MHSRNPSEIAPSAFLDAGRHICRRQCSCRCYTSFCLSRKCGIAVSMCWQFSVSTSKRPRLTHFPSEDPLLYRHLVFLRLAKAQKNQVSVWIIHGIWGNVCFLSTVTRHIRATSCAFHFNTSAQSTAISVLKKKTGKRGYIVDIFFPHERHDWCCKAHYN